MTMRIRAVLVLMLAIASLALLISRAGATEAVSFEAARSISLSGALTMAAETLSVRCQVTLSGSLNTGSLAVTRGTQWGSVSRFSATGCSGGELRTALSLPWPLRFRSVPAEYPTEARSVTLDLSGAALQGTFSGLTCLYSGTVGQQIGLSPERTYEEAWSTGSDTILAEERMSLVSGICPSTARMSGTLSLTPQQQMQRFIGRLGIMGNEIPREMTVVRVSMTNLSPNGSPSIRINPIPFVPLELISVMGAGDNAEMFEFVAGRNFCQGATLPADGGTTVCSTEVEYKERPELRPKRAHLKIIPESNGGSATVNWDIRAR